MKEEKKLIKEYSGFDLLRKTGRGGLVIDVILLLDPVALTYIKKLNF